VRKLRVLSPVAHRTRDHEILRPIRPAAHEREDMINVIGCDPVSAPVAATALSGELACDVLFRMRSGRCSLAGTTVARARCAHPFVASVVHRRIGATLRAVSLVVLVTVGIAFLAVRDSVRSLARSFSRTSRRLLFGVGDIVLAHVREMRFSMILVVPTRSRAVAGPALRLETARPVLPNVEELGTRRLLNAALRTRLERGTIGAHPNLVSVATPSDVPASRGHSVRSLFYHVPVTT